MSIFGGISRWERLKEKTWGRVSFEKRMECSISVQMFKRQTSWINCSISLAAWLTNGTREKRLLITVRSTGHMLWPLTHVTHLTMTRWPINTCGIGHYSVVAACLSVRHSVCLMFKAARQSTPSQMIYEILQSAHRPSDSRWRLIFSLPISTSSALGVSHVMRSINVRCLLTYIFTYVYTFCSNAPVYWEGLQKFCDLGDQDAFNWGIFAAWNLEGGSRMTKACIDLGCRVNRLLNARSQYKAVPSVLSLWVSRNTLLDGALRQMTGYRVVPVWYSHMTALNE